MSDEMLQDTAIRHPKEGGPAPEYPQAKIDCPGSDAELTPQADHGETSYRGLGRLADRVALITGGDSGIGRAIAIAFAREGADVAISYLPEEQRDAEETAKWVTGAGRRALTLPGDIRDERHCQQLIARAFDELGGLDILINNAAFQTTHDAIEEFTTDEFDRTFKTNVYAMFGLCRAAVPRMPPGSVIINTASIQAYDPSANLLAYAATRRDPELYEIALAARDETWHPRQLGCARPGVDAAHPLDDAGGKSEDVWARHAV